jgi:hypothetical protein
MPLHTLIQNYRDQLEEEKHPRARLVLRAVIEDLENIACHEPELPPKPKRGKRTPGVPSAEFLKARFQIRFP